MSLVSPSLTHPDFQHRALFHEGPGDLAARLGPELGGALDRNEPVHLSLEPTELTALRDHVGPALDRATTLDASTRYINPGTAMAEVHGFVQRCLADGASIIWSVGSVQIDGDAYRDARWSRYETAVDHVLSNVPLRGICVYDTSAPDEVLDTVRRCHLTIDEPGVGTSPCRHHQPYRHDTMQWRHRNATAVVDTVVARADEVRRKLTEVLGGALPTERLEDLHLVATELITNGIRHGAPPIELRAWNLPDEVVLEVTDGGTGIQDPFADLRPRRGGLNGGFGMWLLGQLADQVSIGREGDRTVVLASLRRRAV